MLAYVLQHVDGSFFMVLYVWLLQIGVVELLYAVEWNFVHLVIQVGVVCARHNQQFLVVSFQLLECVFAEVARMGFLSMHQQDGTAYLVAVAQDGHIDERERRSFVPAVVGVERALVVAAWCLVIGMVVFHELRNVVGERVDYATGKRIVAVAVVGGALCIELAAHFISGIFVD